MSARSPAMDPSALPSLLGQRRGQERRSCSDAVRVRAGGGEYGARLIDVSVGGLGLRISTLLPLRPGTVVVVIHPQMGELPCLLRWSTHPRYGAAFSAGSHALARAHAFFNSLPRAPGDIV